MRLFWRVVLVNGAVLFLGMTLLAFLPVTVSARVAEREAIALAVGTVLLLGLNALLIRLALAPLEDLRRTMGEVDLLRPSRVPAPSGSDFKPLVAAFNAMLERLEAERGESAARALEAQEGERRRIAQELHDEIGQSLTVVLLSLKRVIDRSSDAAVTSPDLLLAQEAARKSLDDVRQVASRLRPSVLEDLGLRRALVSQASELAATTGARVRRRIQDVEGLSTQVELVLYRIAQEAMTNVARHADARNVEVVLTQTRDGVTLRVSDDGTGLGARSEGAGIRGMRERALLVGGTLEVSTGGDGGTTVTCVIPATSVLRPT